MNSNNKKILEDLTLIESYIELFDDEILEEDFKRQLAYSKVNNYIEKKEEFNDNKEKLAKTDTALMVEDEPEKKVKLKRTLEIRKNKGKELEAEASNLYHEKVKANQDVKKEKENLQKKEKFYVNEAKFNAVENEKEILVKQKEKLEDEQIKLDNKKVEFENKASEIMPMIKEAVKPTVNLALEGFIGEVASFVLYDVISENPEVNRVGEILARDAIFKNILYNYNKELEKINPDRNEIKKLKLKLKSHYTKVRKL